MISYTFSRLERQLCTCVLISKLIKSTRIKSLGGTFIIFVLLSSFIFVVRLYDWSCLNFTGHLWSLLSVFTSENWEKIYFQSWKEKTKEWGMFSQAPHSLISYLLSHHYFIFYSNLPPERYYWKPISLKYCISLTFLYFLHRQ